MTTATGRIVSNQPPLQRIHRDKEQANKFLGELRALGLSDEEIKVLLAYAVRYHIVRYHIEQGNLKPEDFE